VISHRPNDYHPDHRNTGILVQDTAYLVMVPLFNRRVPPLRTNPVYLYFMDRFQSPEPFRPDVVVPIHDVYERKVDALNSMPSQLHEWLPWVDGMQDQIPADPAGRRAFTEGFIRSHHERVWDAALHGKAAGKMVISEAFQLCEYGRQPSLKELRALFPGPAKRRK
jgi:LmbE family N-acetylglucosaminyl deacetylase